MKYGKKTMAIICAAACAATSFALAACGGNDKEPSIKGEQVTEQQWREAIGNTRNLHSLKADYYMDKTQSGDRNRRSVLRQTASIDFDNCKSYYDGMATDTVDGQTRSMKMKDICFLDEEELVEATFYNNGIYYVNSNAIDISDAHSYRKNLFSCYEHLLVHCGVDENDDILTKTIDDLYEMFTYNAKTTEYTATLYHVNDVDESSYSIIFKDGYIVQFGIKYYSDYGDNTYTEEYIYTMRDFDKTDVSIPDDDIADVKNYIQNHS